MTRPVTFAAAMVLVLAAWLTLGRTPVTASERGATAAATTWLDAAVRGDVNAVCAAEAPPASYSGSVVTPRGRIKGAWADVCPQTYDTAELAADAAKYRAALKAGPSTTVEWGEQIRVSYADQNFALYATHQPSGWRVVGNQ